jgi:hypothetical protein
MGGAVDPSTLELGGAVPAAEQLRRAGARFDGSGWIVGIGGIGLGPGYCAITLSRAELSACCAITGQGAVLLLGERATVRASDPVTGREIVMTVSPSGIESVDPPRSVATFAPLRAAAPRSDLSNKFCRFTKYFESATAANDFDTRGHDVLILDLEQAHRAAHLWVSLVWGAEAAP